MQDSQRDNVTAQKSQEWGLRKEVAGSLNHRCPRGYPRAFLAGTGGSGLHPPLQKDAGRGPGSGLPCLLWALAPESGPGSRPDL